MFCSSIFSIVTARAGKSACRIDELRISEWPYHGRNRAFRLARVIPRENREHCRAAFAYFIAAGLVILLIGLTRVYLGAHFLSDVLGAFAASVVWLTFCWTAFETLRRRQKPPFGVR